MNLPSVDLLNQTHSFPGDFTFKVIGEIGEPFESQAEAAVPQAKGRMSKRYTSKHVSVTFEARVKSAEEVLEIYRALGELPGLIMIL